MRLRRKAGVGPLWPFAVDAEGGNANAEGGNASAEGGNAGAEGGNAGAEGCWRGVAAHFWGTVLAFYWKFVPLRLIGLVYVCSDILRPFVFR